MRTLLNILKKKLKKDKGWFYGNVVIIGGNARSGKSTLARRLQSEGYNRISFDLLDTYITDGLGIDFDSIDEEKKFKYFEVVVNESIEEATNEGINIVIDMYDYLPKDIDKLENKDKVEVYFLAYPNISIDDIEYNIVHYAKSTDWIAQVNKDYLHECAIRFYNRNNMLVEECKKYNLTLVDTKSGNDRDIILNKLFEQITNKEKRRN